MADYTIEEMKKALINADKAGDIESAQRIASMIKETQASGASSWTPANPYEIAVEEENTGFIKEQTKLGLADAAFNAVNTISQPLAAWLFDLPAPTQEDLTGNLSREEVKRRDQEYQIALENSKREFAGDLLDYVETIPDSDFERLAGYATRTLAGDPVMSVVGAKGKLGLLTELAYSGSAAFFGAAGAEIGRDIGERNEWSDLATNALSATFATILGMGGYAAPGAVFRGGKTVVSPIIKNRRDTKKALDKIDEAATIVADSQVNTMIKKAVSENANLGDELRATRALASEVPEVVLPAAALAYDNQIIKKNTDSFMQANAEFRGDIKKTLESNTAAINKRAEQLFGDSAPETLQKNLLKYNRNYVSTLNNVQKRINKIDEAIENTASKLRSTENSLIIGERTKGLLDAKIKAVGEKAGEKYNFVLDKYEGLGVKMPGSSVKEIYKEAEKMKAVNAFQDMPSIYNKIKRNFSPEIKVIDGKKYRVFNSVSLKEVDSLKREINKAVRLASDDLKRTTLRDLKTELKNQIGNTDLKFAKEYFGVDEWYYKNAGIPLNSQGLKTLDAKKFAEEAGTQLLKKEVARDFLDYTGAEGVPIVREALLVKLGDSAFKKDGSFSPETYAAFLNRNRETIKRVPGFERELADIGKTLDSYLATRSRINEDYARVSKKLTDNMFSSVYKKGLDSVVNEILKKPELSNKYFDTLSNLTANEARAAKQSVRAALLAKALDSTEGTISFITKNKTAYEKWMGPPRKTPEAPGYLEQIERLGRVNDLNKRIKPENIPYAFSAKQEDVLSEATGSSFPMMGSLFRDRISSGYQKISIILSRFFAKKTHDSRDKALSALLLDPDAIDTISKVADAYSKNKLSVEDFTKSIGMAGLKLGKAGYLGVAAAETVESDAMAGMTE